MSEPRVSLIEIMDYDMPPVRLSSLRSEATTDILSLTADGVTGQNACPWFLIQGCDFS